MTSDTSLHAIADNLPQAEYLEPEGIHAGSAGGGHLLALVDFRSFFALVIIQQKRFSFRGKAVEACFEAGELPLEGGTFMAGVGGGLEDVFKGFGGETALLAERF